jgi:hypothetical protein
VRNESGSEYAGTYALAYQLEEDSMHSLRRCIVAAVGATFATLFGANPVHATTWNEIGDAGDRTNPQFLTGGPYDAISGTIGETDVTDVFAFHWIADGNFSATYAGNDPAVGSSLYLALYNYSGHVEGPLLAGFLVSPPGISRSNLSAGDYLLEITTAPDPGADPPYIIAISGPVEFPIAGVAAVPDKGSSLFLLTCGLLALFAARSATGAADRESVRSSPAPVHGKGVVGAFRSRPPLVGRRLLRH